MVLLPILPTDTIQSVQSDVGRAGMHGYDEMLLKLMGIKEGSY